jgi:hypothetical protein
MPTGETPYSRSSPVLLSLCSHASWLSAPEYTQLAWQHVHDAAEQW